METTFHTEVEYVQVDQINLQPLARHLLGTIREAFKNPAVEAEFQAWKAERDKKMKEEQAQ
ncbi:MAG: hypothetical protein E7316_02430 [Clostridiales bacterium]|nr:hypothetical protein [Clostridiales bacterium]